MSCNELKYIFFTIHVRERERDIYDDEYDVRIEMKSGNVFEYITVY